MATALTGMTYRTRGVHYFRGRVRCPMADVGTRDAFDSNRLVLDDDAAEVVIDHAAGKIAVTRAVATSEKRMVADLMFLADGISDSGRKIPLGLHLKIFATGERVSLDLHRHMRTQDRLVGAEFEPFEVSVTVGKTTTVVLTPGRASDTICNPSLALRAVKALMAMRDHVRDVRQDPRAPGYRVADLSVGFGALGLEWMLARASLESLSGANAELIARGSVPAMLREGVWEMRLTAYSTRWLPEVVKRDLFLFGLDARPLLARVRDHGLAKGETLAFRFERGVGGLRLGEQSETWPGAIDAARAYLEFHMLGGLIAESAERAVARRG